MSMMGLWVRDTRERKYIYKVLLLSLLFLCVSHHAGEVSLHQPLGVQLRLQPSDEGHEVIDRQTLHDSLILLNDRPATVLQDQQSDVPAERWMGRKTTLTSLCLQTQLLLSGDLCSLFGFIINYSGEALGWTDTGVRDSSTSIRNHRLGLGRCKKTFKPV